MFHIPIGTKAQLIKMAPLLREVERRELDYRFVLTGQHRETMSDLIDVFSLRQPDDYFITPDEADSYSKVATWLIKAFFGGLRTIRKETDQDIVLVHGDTLSTLLSAFIAKCKRIKVVHIEAGLRSNNLLNPFPEELTRRLVTYFSDYFIVQDDNAANNLANKVRRYPDRVLNTNANTMLDALNFARRNMGDLKSVEPYAIASLHRNENMSSKSNFKLLMESVLQANKYAPIKFILHPVTKKKLQDSHWNKTLTDSGVELVDRMDYVQFTRLMLGADFLITDGGSNQEEASYIGLPTLIMRRSTERVEGIDSNALLSDLDPEKIHNFLENYNDFRQDIDVPASTVSTQIIDYLCEQTGTVSSL